MSEGVEACVSVVSPVPAVSHAPEGQRLDHHLSQAVVDVDAAARGSPDQQVLNRPLRRVDVQGQGLFPGVDEVDCLDKDKDMW